MLFAPHLSQYLSHVGPRLLASGCELLLDEVAELNLAQQEILEFNAGAGMLTSKLVAHTRKADAQLWVCDEDPLLLRYVKSKKKHPQRVSAGACALPFANDFFDVTLGNAYVLDETYAKSLLKSLARVLKPQGRCMFTGFLAGSFDALFDLAAEAAEAEDASLRQERILGQQQSLLGVGELKLLAENQGFTDVNVGICERALFITNGDALLQDPLVTDLLAPLWLGESKDKPISFAERKRILTMVKESIDAYFADQSFSLRLVTGIFTATCA